MSVAPDMLFHMGGIPVGGPIIPSSSKVYFVDKKNGSDSNDGRNLNGGSLATIAAAITLVNANIDWSVSPWAQRDVIYIMPGKYAENLTSMPYGAIMIGAGYDMKDGENGVLIKPAAGSPVNAGSVINSEFYNLGFESPDTDAAFDCTVSNSNLFYNCWFKGLPAATTAVYAFLTTDTTATTFRNCWFHNADYGVYFKYVDGGDKVVGLTIEGCRITACSAAGIYVASSLVGNNAIVRHNTIAGAGETMTIGIDDNVGIIDESFNAIEATTAVDGVRSSNGSYGNGVLLT